MMFTYLMLSFLFFTTNSCSSDTTTTQEIPTPEGWSLIWNDEFEGSGLPSSDRWVYDVGNHGWGNQERQDYRSDDLETAFLEDGKLVIRTHLIERSDQKIYRSARLKTKGKLDFTYGRVEVRAKLPAGRGLWPAIWMLASQETYGGQFWPDNGEIDIMEYVGYEPDVVHATIHTKARNHMRGTQVGEQITVPSVEEAFHIYTLEWEPDELNVYLDDELYFTYSKGPDDDWQQWPFDQPFHLIMNTAVGGTWGGREGVDDSIFPQRFEIDYVRVYQRPTSN